MTTRRLRGETDILRKHHLPRLRKGGVEGSILVIWVDPPYDKDYVKRTQQIMTCVDAEVKECDEIQIVHTYDEMMQANKAGKIYIFKGIEGLAAIGEDLSKIDKYYDFGCRHAMLTWNEGQRPGRRGPLRPELRPDHRRQGGRQADPGQGDAAGRVPLK